jgi:hypothetical protein
MEGVFTLLVAGTLTLLLLAFAVPSAHSYLTALRAPVATLPARVIATRLREDTGTGWEPAVHYLALFQMPDGALREYEVPETVYRNLRDGQTGTLRARGDRYQEFLPDAR